MSKETTPKQITSMLEQLCNDLNPKSPPLWVEVIPETWAHQNECFPNVQGKIDRDGGSYVNGWVIWQWANIMIEAEAHSVWQSPAGKLVDITPHRHDEHTILFVPDPNVKYEGIVIPNKRAPMTTSPKVAYLIGLMNERDYRLQQSGTSKMCAFPPTFLQEIQKVIADITKKASRNDPCPCGSGLKYKKCCGQYEDIYWRCI
jgi:hypothetical protein